MSEEEKKAINDLIDIKEFGNLSSYLDLRKEQLNSIDIALNLIEKQQKEIEQLANGIRVLGTNPDITTEEIIKEFTEKPISEEYMKKFESSYISKDKIRDYYYRICASVNHFESENDNNIVLRIKKYLEELLGE